MARSSYAATLAGALDQTIAELEREAEASEKAAPPTWRGGYGSTRTTGAPVPSAAPPSSPPPAPVPVPAPAAPPPAEGVASAPPAGAYGAAAGAIPPPLADIPYAPVPAPYASAAPAAAPPPPDVIDGNLSAQIRRLEELRRWVRDDPAFGRLVDNMIGRQVQAAEKRQRLYAGALSVISLVVGWLLPALVPVTNLAHLLPH